MITDNGVFNGARVIVTVPLGVLKRGSIQFSPALPEPKLGVIKSESSVQERMEESLSQ